MSGAYQVRGADELRVSLGAAADDLRDLSDAGRRAGDTVVSAARGRAPRRTGALAASVFAVADSSGVRVAAGVVWAGPVHWGWPARNIAAQPFLSDAATTTEATWVGFYADAVVAAVQGVKGA